MRKYKTINILVACNLIMVIYACNPAAAPAAAEVVTKTQVTVTTIGHENIAGQIELNATSIFLLKSFIKANATGYLTVSDIKPGVYLKNGQFLFTIKTKEAENIGNAVNQLDSTFRFTGTNRIYASHDGYVAQLDHQTGDYVQDGEQLAIINGSNSFVFLMDMPYELKPFIVTPKDVELLLPDSTVLHGTVTSSMPNVDPVSQTQKMVIKIKSGKPVPENLVAKVKIKTYEHKNSTTLPISALVTDEQQAEFWVMKVVGDTMALKVPVKKGMQSNQNVEILEPVLSDSDKFITSGSYGLEDSARIVVTAKQITE